MATQSRNRLVPTVQAFLLMASGSAAAIAGYGFVDRSLEDGSVGRLSLGLGLWALAAAGAGALLWVLWRALADTRGPARASSDIAFRWDVIVTVVALPAEVSLSWLTVVLAADEHPGAAWLTGVVALVLASVWLYRLCGDLATDAGAAGLASVAALTVTAGSAGWLAVSFAVDERYGPAVALGFALPLIVVGAFALRAVDEDDLTPTNNRGAGAVAVLLLSPAAGLGGVTARTAVDGQIGSAVLTGLPALLLVLAARWWVGAWAHERIERGRMHRHRFEDPLAYSGDRWLREVRYAVREALEEAGYRAGGGYPAPYRSPGGPDRLSARELDALASRVADGIASSVADRVTERLAGQVARATSDGIGTDVWRQLANGLEMLSTDLQRSIRANVQEMVLGPPLANFTGYLSVHLGDEDGEGGGAGHRDGMVLARAGSRIRLVLAVAQDDRARDVPASQETASDRDFYIFEPVHVQGGRAVPTVEFEAVVDSSSLTPLPQRRTLRVDSGQQQQRSFSFQLPEQEGQHEVWFQLYQAGRLIQALALTVHARPRAVETAEETGRPAAHEGTRETEVAE